MEDEIYLAFLIGVERISVAFATYTHFTKMASDESKFEMRVPSVMPRDFPDNVLETIDRNAVAITD